MGTAGHEDRLELKHLRELQQAEILCCNLWPQRGSSTLTYCTAFLPLRRISQPWLPTNCRIFLRVPHMLQLLPQDVPGSPFLSCRVWKTRPSRSREEAQPALKHYPSNLCYCWAQSHVVLDLLCFHPLHAQQRDASFPKKCWVCSTNWNPCYKKYSIILIKKAYHVTR